MIGFRPGKVPKEILKNDQKKIFNHDLMKKKIFQKK